MDCGLITDCPPYTSQMKLLDYAASGCLVLAPYVVHLENLYLGKGVLFFTRRESTSLADKLKALILGDIAANEMAQTLQKHVLDKHT